MDAYTAAGGDLSVSCIYVCTRATKAAEGPIDGTSPPPPPTQNSLQGGQHVICTYTYGLLPGAFINIIVFTLKARRLALIAR